MRVHFRLDGCFLLEGYCHERAGHTAYTFRRNPRMGKGDGNLYFRYESRCGGLCRDV